MYSVVVLNILGFHPGQATIKCLISYLDLLKILRFISNFSMSLDKFYNINPKNIYYIKLFSSTFKSYLETLLIRLNKYKTKNEKDFKKWNLYYLLLSLDFFNFLLSLKLFYISKGLLLNFHKKMKYH